MPYFRLEPVAGTEEDASWRCSALKARSYWARADSDRDARETLSTLARIVDHVPHDEQAEHPIELWKDPARVTCRSANPPSHIASLLLGRPGIAVDDMGKAHARGPS